MRFEIGDEVWVSSFEMSTDYVTCPECGGTGIIRCLLHDDTMVSIDCQGCARGYERPSGIIPIHHHKPFAIPDIVTGYETTEAKTEWKTTNRYRVSDDDIFETEPPAIAKAQEKSDAFDAEERNRIQRKEKDTRSWSWHVHYYRKQIRDAEKTIEHARERLAVASLKAKADKINA